MVRPLTAADGFAARSLLRARPLHNVFLDYVVAAGVLGRAPGFLGWFDGPELRALLMIGPQGGTALEVRDPAAFAPLAEAAAREARAPRHIVGSADVTEPFWREYAALAPRLRWTRREPVFVLTARELAEADAPPAELARARDGDVDEIAANSAEQHREDLDDDRAGADPAGFRERHRKDVRDGRWWVLRERGAIAFQVHVGAASAAAVQLGGVFVPRAARGRGIATRGVAGIAACLLRSHPAVTLYCDEANAAAQRVYSRVGFRVAYANRSYLIQEPEALPAHPDYA